MDRRLMMLAGGAAAAFGIAAVLLLRFMGTAAPADEAPRAEKSEDRRVTRFGGGRGEATTGAGTTAPGTPHAEADAGTTGPGSHSEKAQNGEADTLEDPEPPDLGVELSAWPISKEGIKGAVQEVSPAVKDCYEANLEAVADLAGRLVVSFTVTEVDGVGKVTAVDAPESTVNDGPLEDCVLDVMQALQFDAPDEPTNVSYPFIFATE